MSNKSSRKSAGKVAVLAMLLALVIIFICVPVSISGISLAMCLVPILISALVQSFGITAILTLIMAIGLWASAFVSASPVAAIFRNPLVGIVPRLAVGLVAYGLYHGLLRLASSYLNGYDAVKPGDAEYKQAKSKAYAMRAGFAIAACLLGTLSNTLLVSLNIWLCYIVGNMPIDSNLPMAFFEGAVVINAVIEAVAFTVLVPPIAAAIDKAGYGIKSKRKLKRAPVDKELGDIDNCRNEDTPCLEDRAVNEIEGNNNR
ncbi:MAG: hypothetical protein K2M44_01415 [Clostridia bacterium]|nr:hypothetical protein [Clostridia bacterium]